MRKSIAIVALASCLALNSIGVVSAQNYYNPHACMRGFYLSPSTGACVRQPTYERRQGAVAFCADEKFSYALDPYEACAGPHGGVAKWLAR